MAFAWMLESLWTIATVRGSSRTRLPLPDELPAPEKGAPAARGEGAAGAIAAALGGRGDNRGDIGWTLHGSSVVN
jgi:hypothetical protein